MNRATRRTNPARTALAVLSSAALMATLGACGGSASGEEADALTDVSLVFGGALTVCTDMPYAPFEYEEKGKPTGFDIDLVRKVADDLEAELDVVDVSFDDITSGTSLNNDVCDVAISAMTITGERARVLDFSSPYFDAKQALITPKGSGLDQISELAGQRVGVQKDTTGETYLSDFAPETTQVTISVWLCARPLAQAFRNGGRSPVATTPFATATSSNPVRSPGRSRLTFASFWNASITWNSG